MAACAPSWFWLGLLGLGCAATFSGCLLAFLTARAIFEHYDGKGGR